MSHNRFSLSVLSGFLAACLAIGIVAFVAWAAVPQGSSVIYTGSDVVLMPSGTTFSGQLLNALGTFTSSASFNLAGILTPSQITANQNNYSPTNLATANFLRLSSDASREITGLGTGTSGRLLTLHNVGSQNLVLRAESGSSTDVNRFAMPSDLTLQANAMVVLQYDNTSQRWRTISPTLTGGPLNAATLTLQQQGSDAATPGAGNWVIYSKSTGIFTRDSAGNVYGPFGTGGGGGGTGITTVRVATTANITLSGTQTIDGVSNIGAAGEVVLVKNQSTATQNGIYVASSGAWTRSTSFDTSGEFVAGFPVYVQSGTANGGTVWNFSVVGSFTLGSTDVAFTRTGAGAFGELLANKNVNSGYLGLRSDGTATHDRMNSYAAHTPVAAAGTITPTALTMGIEGSTDPGTTDFTAGHDQIADGVRDQLLILVGTSATALVKLDNGDNVRLCGNTGSVTIGLNGPKPILKWNATLSVWEQIDCQDLQGIANVGRSIIADESTPFIIKDAGGTNRMELYIDSGTNLPTSKGVCSGGACDSIVQLSSGKDFIVKKHDGTTLFDVDNDTGTVTGLTVPPQILMAVLYPGFATCGFTSYWAPIGQTAGGTGGSPIEADANIVITSNRTVKNLRFKAPATIESGATYTMTVHKNNAATALTCSVIEGGSTGTGEVSDAECADATHSFSVVAGDLLNIEVVCSGGSSGNPAAAMSMELE